MTVRSKNNPFSHIPEFIEKFIRYRVEGLIYEEIPRAIAAIQPDLVINCIGLIKKQEECCLFHVPAVTLWDVTERPETVKCGCNMLSGANPNTILRCMGVVTSRDPVWAVPVEYLASNVSDTGLKILLGFHWIR